MASPLPSTSQCDFNEEPWNTNKGHSMGIEEDIILHRGAVGSTAATPIDHIENSLGGNTPRDSLTPDSTHRGAVGNTTVTPISHTENTNYQEIGILTSPATSTPGSTPVSNKNGELKKSELQRSEESMIGSSIIIEEKRHKLMEDDDIITIKMSENTLYDKSVEEEESYDVEDTSWETTTDRTNCGKEGPTSCVAQRTRSHTEDLRKNNLSQVLEGCDNTTMEGSFVCSC